MVDYSKQTVAQLRQLLKDRNIASTGLTRKAQIIEKLEEADAERDEAQEAGAVDHGEYVDATAPDAAGQVDADHASADGAEPEAALTREIEPAPLPAATIHPQRELLPHVDSDIPAPDDITAVKGPEDDATVAEEAGTNQPAGDLDAPPAGPEAGNHIRQPTAPEALLAVPGPAAEALPPADLPTADTSRLNTEELEADTKKRKRRSETPDMPLEDVKAKKHRLSHEPVPDVHLKEDEDEDVSMEQAGSSQTVQIPPSGLYISPAEGGLSEKETEPDSNRQGERPRYEDIQDTSPRNSAGQRTTDQQGPTVPAVHPVTAALYIRNLMRPLRPETLRAHLTSLASPPSSVPDASTVKTVFLDAMRTHALVVFNTPNEASRARASLHGSIWPPEGNRKELWVDFVPENHVEDWIRAEEDAAATEKAARGKSRLSPPKRFEVVYRESGDGTTAVFQELGASVASHIPSGPRRSDDMRTLPQSTAPVPSKEIETPFKTLDELFSSTVAKPRLYYLPISDVVSEARLKELEAQTSRDWAPGEVRKGRGIRMEVKYKYSFDDEARIVEISEDRGPWSESYRGGRGGSRGRGRGGGPFRGRGGMGWRD